MQSHRRQHRQNHRVMPPVVNEKTDGSFLSDVKGEIRVQTMRHICASLVMIGLMGCASVGTVGMITKSTSDPLYITKTAHPIKELGPAQGEACRYFLFAIIPWGKSDLQVAVDQALTKVGGDALVNVAVSSGLYGFIPIYNVLSYTCTTVKGTAVKFE